MRRSLSLTLLGLPLMLALGCSGGGNSNAPVPVTPSTPSANTAVFSPGPAQCLSRMSWPRLQPRIPW